MICLTSTNTPTHMYLYYIQIHTLLKPVCESKWKQNASCDRQTIKAAICLGPQFRRHIRRLHRIILMMTSGWTTTNNVSLHAFIPPRRHVGMYPFTELASTHTHTCTHTRTHAHTLVTWTYNSHLCLYHNDAKSGRSKKHVRTSLPHIG